jgi:hypothetical protein
MGTIVPMTRPWLSSLAKQSHGKGHRFTSRLVGVVAVADKRFISLKIVIVDFLIGGTDSPSQLRRSSPMWSP